MSQPDETSTPAAPVFDRTTVRAMLDLFAVEGSEFRFNETNDYGVISLDLFTGRGDPSELYRGEAIRAQYAKRGCPGETEERPTGQYRLHDRLVDEVLRLMRAQARHRAGLPASQEPSVYVLRLVPAFDGHPAFQKTYYTGAPERFDEPAARPTTHELAKAARYLDRDAAITVAAALLPTKSCVWVVEDLVNDDHMAVSTHEAHEDTLARLDHAVPR